ncbi:DNA-binding transcriptional regulator, LysR family [Andreprevotia lacus DSM 23236]|jgi:DNA-binding transcriptional LysR family regulator|uniref:DNA-binding transcriptional regulator, LysR family n=1 Tax=Andreprevotia lacus DSM 23236 TaxID=1121001 RepID=A0A1W1XK13_9NEIS|nr:LysR family transcriptional regulator [Andreprevotia lacus]SMC24114.1 DNA-binding transcriptional regulator, LysR family [Andreprevotia lacus DSM 23236]
MSRFHQMTVYVAVAETESFSAAARKLALSPPAVTRAVAALEEELGVKLLIRTTRHVRVTDAGQRYLDDARRILAELQEADEAAAGLNAEPRGHLAITAPVLFGQLFVMPNVVRFLQRYPAVDVSALFLDRVVNMLEEGVDVGIRIGNLQDSAMRAIRVGRVRRVLCASPDYLAQHGIPHTPDDLQRHQIVAATNTAQTVEWKFGDGDRSQSQRLKPRLTVTSNDGAIAAVRAGAGITRLLSYQVAALLQSGELKTVLSEFEGAPIPIHIVHREGRHGSAKVRSFVDFMAEALKSDGALN